MTEDQTPPMSRPRVAAGALFFDDQGRVLLVKPTYKEGWDIPGGYVEPGETPLEACAREIREELGISREIGPLLVIDWAPSVSEGDKVLFVFEGGDMTREDQREIALPHQELSECAFYEQELLDRALNKRLTKRINAAIEARIAGQTAYLEHGVRL